MSFFIGSPLSEKDQERLQNFLMSLDFAPEGLKHVPPAKWHITYAFMGELPPPQVDTLTEGMAKWQLGKSFDISVDLIDAFPAMARSVVLWCGSQKQPERLHAVQSQIITELGALGISYDEKPFLPHITLGRFRRPTQVRPISLKQSLSFTLTSVVLFESLGLERYVERAKVLLQTR